MTVPVAVPRAMAGGDVFRSTETVPSLSLATTTSSWPSPFTSATAVRPHRDIVERNTLPGLQPGFRQAVVSPEMCGT